MCIRDSVSVGVGLYWRNWLTILAVHPHQTRSEVETDLSQSIGILGRRQAAAYRVGRHGANCWWSSRAVSAIVAAWTQSRCAWSPRGFERNRQVYSEFIAGSAKHQSQSTQCGHKVARRKNQRRSGKCWIGRKSNQTSCSGLDVCVDHDWNFGNRRLPNYPSLGNGTTNWLFGYGNDCGCRHRRTAGSGCPQSHQSGQASFG